MLSLPLDVFGTSTADVFPHSNSQAFNYSGSGYAVADFMQPGVGYWLKFPAAEDVTITGLSILTSTVDVRTGWNMVGALGAKIAVADITADPPGMATSEFFGFEGGYVTADTLMPGKGYWVKVNQSGTLALSSSPAGAAARIAVVPTPERPPAPPGQMDEAPVKTPIPREYALEQAYPNPFNPATTIRYQLPEASAVSLKVYNLLGQVVGTLKDGEVENGGYHAVIWNAGALASGMYFYRLDAVSVSDPSKGISEVRKMVLIK